MNASDQAPHTVSDVKDLRASARGSRAPSSGQPSTSEEGRKVDYRKLVNELYFNLVTDLYVLGWGKSFHFAPRRAHESFPESLRRLEQGVAAALQVSRGDEVIDIGCGVGGPMLEIARVSGARITGVNVSEAQIERGREYARRAGVADRCQFTRADYLHLPMADGSFDAAYTLCAMPQPPDKRRAYGEIARVLKAGAILAGTDWCLTSRFDPASPAHADLKRRIQQGAMLPDIDTSEALRGHLGAHFEILSYRDIALDCDPESPWYLALSARERSLRGLVATPFGRKVTQAFSRAMELTRLPPKTTTEVAHLLSEGGGGLVEAAEAGIFSVVSYVARKIR